MGSLTEFLHLDAEVAKLREEIQMRDKYHSNVVEPEFEALAAKCDEYEERIEFLEEVVASIGELSPGSFEHTMSEFEDLWTRWQKYYGEWIPGI